MITQQTAGVTNYSARKLKILFDARKILDGGIGQYIKNTLLGLKRAGIYPEILINSDVYSNLSDYQLNWLEDFNPVFEPSKSYSLNEYLRLASRIDFSKYDLAHFPHYTLPFKINIPTVVTVHDLIHITHPEKFYYPLVARKLIGSALKRANAVVTVSNASADSLCKEFKTTNIEKKLTVIPNSINPDWLESKIDNSAKDARKSYYLSIFSNLKPHKGYQDLLCALKNTNCIVKLVGLGLKDISYHTRLIEKHGLSKQVEILGPVNEHTLKDLYKNATALIIPSLAEGFCLPLIEAHAAGIPVVMRPIPALLENALSSDIVASDLSIEALTNALNVLDSSSNELNLENDFLKQVNNKFNIDLVTTELINLYEGICE
jgi:glycosyltransferase involved in cell wall biosynthesis